MAEPTPADTIHEFDKAKRLEQEALVLKEAQECTNGCSEDPEKIGRIRLWQVEALINQGQVIRQIAAELPLCRRVKDCVEVHKPKTWLVRVFGVTYSAPVTIAVLVIGFCFFMFCRKNGWM